MTDPHGGMAETSSGGPSLAMPTPSRSPDLTAGSGSSTWPTQRAGSSGTTRDPPEESSRAARLVTPCG
jgi:hypothetical protein